MENGKYDQEVCRECDLATDERLNYFTGQFLAERDFRAEQEYQIGKHRQHNRYLHGYGTVCGLKIVQHPNLDCRDRFVILEPGLALDCCGREIVVKEKVYIDLVKLFAAQNIDLKSIDPKEKNHLLFSLCYEECKTEFVPALYSECGCDEFGCDANRIVEGFEIHLQLLKDLPKPQHEEPVGVNLDWITTLSLDNAFRVVLDPKGERIYVLTAANPSQIMVYEATHHCLLYTIPLLGGKPGVPEGRGVDLAIAPTGQFLYILRYVEIPSSPGSGNYFLQVIQVKDTSTGQDLPQAQRIETTDASGDFPLNSGFADKPPQIVASQKKDSNNIYTLDLNAQKISIWNAQIITKANADPSINVGSTNSPKLNEVNTGSNPRSIAVSPDDNWVLLGEAGTDNAIKVFKVGTSQLVNPPISIPTTDPPVLLAVSADSLRLYSVTNSTTGDKKVRAFRLEDSSQPFPEIKPAGAASFSGIEIGIDIPVAIAVSPSGKWAYVLLKDSASKGIIKVVDGDKIATDPTQALSPSVFSVVSEPQYLVLEPEGRRLYAAGKGSSSLPSCGGVSVIDVKETQCSEIIWQALDGCPECPEDNCVPLAIVEDYVKNYQKDPKITNNRLENRKFRPLVPSTETLKQLVMCALETGGGTKGQEGLPGSPGIPGTPGSKWLNGTINPTNALVANPGDYYLNTTSDDVYRRENDSSWTLVGNIKGNPGNDGTPGEGLESGLTQIVALSWTHNNGKNPLVTIIRENKDLVRGIVIAFTRRVLVSNPLSPFQPPNQIDADHVFQVLVEHDPRLKKLGVVCRCPIKGRILPVRPTLNGKLITAAEEIPGPMARAAAFIFDDQTILFDDQGFPRFRANEGSSINEIWVRLHGDFVLDSQEPTQARAIDAEFVRAELPTGDRPRGSNVGIQGGTFESWFWIGDRPQPDKG
ncbi:MAG: hypothetical protein V7K69_20880 [Nostoc sp.]